MSDIAIRKQNENRATHANELAWDPWRTMRSLLSWDPFREMATFPTPGEGTFAVSPAFDVKETKDAYEFKADVPGIQDKDLEVSMTGNRLTVSGKRDAEKEDRGERYYTYERSYGSFTRSFGMACTSPVLDVTSRAPQSAGRGRSVSSQQPAVPGQAPAAQ